MLVRQRKLEAGAFCPQCTIFVYKAAFEEIHRRTADEACHKSIGRSFVELLGRALLLQNAFGHDHNPVAERHGFNLVMGHVDHVFVQRVAHLCKLGSHPRPKLRIQIRKRFIEQESRSVADQRPSHGDSLTLAAGKLRRLALQQLLDIQHFRDVFHSPVDIDLGKPLKPECEGHVPRDVHVRVKRVVLKDHRDIAVLGFQTADRLVVEPDFTGRQGFKTGEYAQRGGFSATGGPNEHGKLAVIELQAKRRKNSDTSKMFFDVIEADSRQFELPEHCHSIRASNSIGCIQYFDSECNVFAK